LESDERSTLRALMRYQRESVVRKVEGVDEAAARWSPVDSGTSLLWLVRHLAAAESLWFERRFAGLTPTVTDDVVRPGDTLGSAIAAYRDVCTRTDAIVDAADFDAPCRQTDGQSSVTLRWVVMHLLEETARHAGHADLLRELIDGDVGR
jgi:hypothetical protein